MYCNVCGSGKVAPVSICRESSSERKLRPTVEAGGLGASLGSIATTTATSVTYDAYLCSLCGNIVDASIDASPVEIHMSDYEQTIVIPYNLASLLRSYEPEELVVLVRIYRVRLDTIFRQWSKTGRNDCRNCRVGKKISIQTKYVAIECWVIIECSDVCYIRLSYGGGKIQCP